MVLDLLILILIGTGIWFFVKKNKKEGENPSKDNRTSENSTNVKFCGECGAPIKETNNFCPDCGTKVEELTATHQETSHPQKSKSSLSGTHQKTATFKRLINLFGLVIFILIGYILYTSYQTGGNLQPYVTSLSFSSNGSKLVTAASDNHIQLWDTAKKESTKRKKIASAYGIHRALTWNEHKNIIALARVNPSMENEIILFDDKTLTQVSKISTGNKVPIALCIDPYDNYLYSVTDRLGIDIWDITNNKHIGGLENMPYNFVTSASFDRDCQTIATMEGTTTTKNSLDTTNKKLIVYNRINMETLFEKVLDDKYAYNNTIGLSANAKNVNTLDAYTGELHSWDITTYEHTETTLNGISLNQSFTLDANNNIAIAQGKGFISIHDNNGNHTTTLQHGTTLGILLSPVLNLFD